jgi:hypothetical protein
VALSPASALRAESQPENMWRHLLPRAFLNSLRSITQPAFLSVASVKDEVLSIRRYCGLEFIETERRGASNRKREGRR